MVGRIHSAQPHYQAHSQPINKRNSRGICVRKQCHNDVQPNAKGVIEAGNPDTESNPVKNLQYSAKSAIIFEIWLSIERKMAIFAKYSAKCAFFFEIWLSIEKILLYLCQNFNCKNFVK